MPSKHKYTVCTVEGCDKTDCPGRRHCGMHAARLRLHGDVNYSYKSPEEVAKRFWAKVDKTPGHGPQGSCWIWIGKRDPDGYGLNSASQYKYERRAHRFSYTSVHGSIDADLVIRHKCDNPPCVNPDHLEPGTNIDNVRDRGERGRDRKGSDSPHAKLTEADIPAIRTALAAGASKVAVARKFQVSHGVIYSIHRGETWKHVE